MKAETVEEARITQEQRCVRVLFLAGSLAEAERLVRESRGPGLRMEATIAASQKEFKQARQSGRYDAVVADARMPGWSAQEALREVRAGGDKVPFLLVTDRNCGISGMEYIKDGANDCIAKEHLSRLPLALYMAIEDSALKEEAARAHRALAASEASAQKQYEELEVIYRCAPFGFAVFDRKNRFVRVNEALAKFSSVKPEAFAGRAIEEVVPEFAR